MKYTIDVGDTDARVALAVCACGWRGLATTKPAAFARLLTHEETQHPEDHNVRDALRSRRSRKHRNVTPRADA